MRAEDDGILVRICRDSQIFTSGISRSVTWVIGEVSLPIQIGQYPCADFQVVIVVEALSWI